MASTVDTDASVGGSWSTGDHAHTRCARGLGVGFRHEARPTFVAVGDELDLLGVPQTVQDGREAFAWDIEHVAYALVAQTVHNSVAAIHPACFGCGWHCFPHCYVAMMRGSSGLSRRVTPQKTGEGTSQHHTHRSNPASDAPGVGSMAQLCSE